MRHPAILLLNIYIYWQETLLWATRGAHNPDFQVAVIHEWLVWSKHSFGLPPIMYGMQRMQSDHVRFDPLSLGTINKKHSDLSCLQFLVFGYLLVNAIINN